jgi:hypothetical protein
LNTTSEVPGKRTLSPEGVVAWLRFSVTLVWMPKPPHHLSAVETLSICIWNAASAP